ncbi:hypothetical protein BE20_19450 [Sorangium cellulosum]|uniref:Uncharacterized protein n=1 Tax=Sorangium cellulosum TaxID=56 RepID=A0A150SBL0_SORCE|nr:hypothetical protein BE18_04135 [Sorangium cellulosum]KYF89835.1 hypothetical protein BE20_19450 [Sorangium cellulosum]
MRLLHPSPEEARIGLRAMKMIASRDGDLSAAARNLLMAAQRHVLRTDDDLDALPPIAPEALAKGFVDPALREQLVSSMLVLSLTDGPPSPAQLELVRSFAEALGVRSEALHDVELLAKRHMLLFYFDFLRRGHIGDMVKQQYEATGLLGLVKALLGLRGLLEDRELAARYHALERLPEGTLGHALVRHYRDNGFAFPGERHGFPEAAVYHDLTHVLSGYGTDPAGELKIGAFIAGYRRTKSIYMLLFVMLTFSAGINLTPLPQPQVVGILERPGLADDLLVAIERGGQLNTDLSDHWDFWPLLPLPVAEARRSLGLLS